MKREIISRGQRTDNGEWVYGDLIINRPTQDFKIITDAILVKHGDHTNDGLHYFSGHIYDVDKSTVGQFTGLKDRNGVAIFEGDIILFTWFIYGEYELEHECKGTVEFWSGSYMFCCEHENYPFSELSFDSESDIEIIGNIHDNPELIENLE